MANTKTVSEETFSLSSNLFKNLVSAISVVVEEAQFTSSPDGTTFRAMDPSHVNLLDVLIPSAKTEQEHKWCLRVDDLQKIAARTKKEDVVQVTVGKDVVTISLVGKRKRVYENPTLESTNTDTPLPKMDLLASFSTDREEFLGLLDDIAVKSNHVRIGMKNRLATLSGKGDSGSVNITLSRTLSDYEADAIYSIDNLQKHLKSISVGSVRFNYGPKMPVRIDSGLDDCEIHYYIAPRVQE